MPAKIGLANFMFAPFATEPDDALPTYEANKAVKIGGAVQANLTLTFASGQDHADNELTEEVNDFVSGTIATEIDNLELETEAVVYGSKIDEATGELSDSTEDAPPYGGASYYQLLQIKGKKVFRGVFYPKTKASLGADNAQTKTSGVTFQHTNPNFTVFNPQSGSWRYRQEFETEAEVISWQKEKLGITSGTP